MSEEAQWRDRYLKIAEQLDENDAKCKAAESDLLRLIGRLCVACQGLDPMLDPHLKKLRKAVRDGMDESLQMQAQAIGDALIQAQEDRVDTDLVSRLLSHSPLSNSVQKKVCKQWRNLAAEPGKVNDDQVRKLAVQVFPRAAGQENGNNKGILGRLLHRGGDVDPNQMLRDLLIALKWPAIMQSEVKGLASKLKDDAPEDAWVSVVKRISELAVKAFEQAHQDAEAAGAFLSQLSERLLSIDEYMAGEGERRRESQESGQRLGTAVSDEVGGLSASMHASEGLEELRDQVTQALDRIQGHVTEHLHAEMERNGQAEDQADLMAKQLEELQRETFDLRRQVAQSYQQALTDALTGLPNRRAYEERATQELARWRRFKEPLALVVWDVDDFKKINDVFGHKAGDRALAVIAHTLQERVREADFIARYGGEEFVLLLSGSDQEGALAAAEAMRQAVERAGLHSHNKPVKITLSGGLAMLEGDETIEALFERADEAMYKAKKAGKNQVVVA